jgi:SNF2 family DNA or RNA helicase
MAWAAVDPDGLLTIGAAKSEFHLCEQIPGCNHSKADGLWRLPLSWPGYVAMKTVWASQPLTESPQLLDWAGSAWGDIQIAYGLRSAMDAQSGIRAELDAIEGMPSGPGLPDPRLFGYQRGAVQWLVSQKRAGLVDPRGNGKTPPLIRAIQVLHQRRKLTGEQITPALLICTSSKMFGYVDEFATWAPELRVQVVSGTALRRRQALEAEADVYLISWGSLRYHTRLANYPGTRFVRCTACGGGDERVTAGRCEVHLKELNARDWMVIIADEAHRMKDARSKQTRAAWWMAHNAPYFWPVTGTPVGENIGDFWPIGHAIDPRSFPSRSRYLDLFAVKNLAWHGGTEILGIRPEHEAAFQSIVQPLIRRIPRELARPEQPPLLPPTFRYPEMTAEQSKAYRQLAKESLADLGGHTTVPANTAVKFGRLCQLAYASLEIRDGEDAQGFTTQVATPVLPSNKADDLLDFIEGEMGSDQLVVYANSPKLVELCERKLNDRKITHTRITGAETPYARHESERWFQDGQVQVIFITMAGGESINLTAASTILFLQPNPSFMATDQITGRVDRVGQNSPVKVVYSITPGTVEKRLHQLSREKAERAGAVTRDADLLRWIIKGEDQDGTQAQHTASAAGQESLF